MSEDLRCLRRLVGVTDICFRNSLSGEEETALTAATTGLGLPRNNAFKRLLLACQVAECAETCVMVEKADTGLLVSENPEDIISLPPSFDGCVEPAG